MTTPDPTRPQDWDGLFDFLADETEFLSPEEIRANLHAHQIDLSGSLDRVKRMIGAARARAALSAAAANRQRLLDGLGALRQAAARPLDAAKRQISEVLAPFAGGAVAQTYFNRLESAATPEDIQSLLEDLEALDLLKDQGHDTDQAE